MNLRAVAVLFVSSLALAGDGLTDARTLYANGQFSQAAQVASVLGTSSGLALAARATSISALNTAPKGQEALYVEAERLASQAVKLSSDNPDAHFELARASGRLGELRGVANAILNGVGTRVRQSLERALQLKPDHDEAMVALAAWHAEVSARGGLAAGLLGANPKLIEPLIAKALALQPGNIGHRLEYAHVLHLMNSTVNRARVLEQLRIAVKLSPEDAEQRIYLEAARAELERLK